MDVQDFKAVTGDRRQLGKFLKCRKRATTLRTKQSASSSKAAAGARQCHCVAAAPLPPYRPAVKSRAATTSYALPLKDYAAANTPTPSSFGIPYTSKVAYNACRSLWLKPQAPPPPAKPSSAMPRAPRRQHPNTATTTAAAAAPAAGGLARKSPFLAYYMAGLESTWARGWTGKWAYEDDDEYEEEEEEQAELMHEEEEELQARHLHFAHHAADANAAGEGALSASCTASCTAQKLGQAGSAEDDDVEYDEYVLLPDAASLQHFVQALDREAVASATQGTPAAAPAAVPHTEASSSRAADGPSNSNSNHHLLSGGDECTALAVRSAGTRVLMTSHCYGKPPSPLVLDLGLMIEAATAARRAAAAKGRVGSGGTRLGRRRSGSAPAAALAAAAAATTQLTTERADLTAADRPQEGGEREEEVEEHGFVLL